MASFIEDGWTNGWAYALQRSITFTFTPIGFFVPIGIGLGVIFIILINAPGNPEKRGERTKGGKTST
ncbi:hypothetical protein EO087_06935 [Dyella sp. M7H15-1]|uniref:hypothetical protein n=1 Tax=Dyella sp. M7H15-1 TaxID=2501295 RepID=UPI001004F48D|nr:hypothetical protein [Dyella sp. M7H15-1]QAU23749.1 hypothetical protein EO087_06935 [Dyella sp. M7H15-1]